MCAEGMVDSELDPRHIFFLELPIRVLSEAYSLCLFFRPGEPGGTEVIRTTGSGSRTRDMTERQGLEKEKRQPNQRDARTVTLTVTQYTRARLMTFVNCSSTNILPPTNHVPSSDKY